MWCVWHCANSAACSLSRCRLSSRTMPACQFEVNCSIFVYILAPVTQTSHTHPHAYTRIVLSKLQLARRLRDES
jgi:hypothetical protein